MRLGELTVLVVCTAASIAAQTRPSMASFDCTKARTPAEKLICSNAGLGALDKQLAADFRSLLGEVPRPSALRSRQADWLSGTRDKAQDAASMAAAYRERSKELASLRQQTLDLRNPVDINILSRSCLLLRHEKNETCKVDNSGSINVASRYQVQDYFEGGGRTAGGVVVLIDDGNGHTRPVAWAEEGSAHFEKPVMVDTATGRLLALDGEMEGTAHFNAGSVFRGVEEEWKEVDSTSWLGDVLARVPKGLSISKGVYPDWKKMTADAPLWKDGDPDCCPTGGSFHATLALRGDRIVLQNVQTSSKPLQ